MVTQYEVPAEMREFAERSVAQARQAFEGFMGAVHKTSNMFDSSATPTFASAKDISTKAVAFAEANVNAAFDFAEKLVHAKDLQDVLKLQSEYLQSQLEAVQQQAREMGSTVQSTVGGLKKDI